MKRLYETSKNATARLAWHTVIHAGICPGSLCRANCAPQAASETPATAEAATGEGEEIVITHAQGETTVVKNPAVVVVFDYSVLDTLDQLGVPVAAVPQGTNIPAFLEKYKGSEYANAGTLFEPDYEKVNELQPDLIMVAGRSSTVYPELAASQWDSARS